MPGAGAFSTNLQAAQIAQNYTMAVRAYGIVGATQTLNLNSGNFMTATLTSATATVFTMPPPADGKSFTLFLRQPATGTVATATFTPAVAWVAGGIAPVISQSLGGIDILSFVSDGVVWMGQFTQGMRY
jgi:hypothetical protein